MEINEAQQLLLSLRMFFGNILESNFTTALAGAWAGAWAAQKIAEKENQKRRVLDEIRSTNAAIALSISITNSFLGLKRQHVRDLIDSYEKAKNDFAKAREEKRINQSSTPLELRFDLRSLPQFQNPTDDMKAIVFEKLSVTGGVIALTTVLSQCIDGLWQSRKAREDVIEQFKERKYNPQQQFSVYLGLNNDSGSDTRYSDAMEGISKQTDDCIYFSKMLADKLNEHGKNLQRIYGKKAPKISKGDFSRSEKEGLLPHSDQYPDWAWLNESSPSSM